MDEQTLVFVIAGALVAAFGGFASYMADRQKKQAMKERQDKNKKKHQHDDHLGHAGT